MSGKSSPVLIVRLAIMMFLQFFIWGAWYVAMYNFLDQAGMTTPSELGFSFDAAAYTVAPIAAIIAPLTLGLICDRLLNTEWVLAILNLVGAGLLWYAPSLASAGVPESYLGQFTHPMMLCLLAYMICFMPTLGLTASLSFKHLANGEKEFPVVRVLGTIGWIAGGWIMLGCRLFTGDEAEYADNSPHIFHAAAIASVLLGVYCLTLPKTEPPAKGEAISIGRVLGVDAWSMLRDKAFFVFAVASFLVCIPLAGYYAQGAGYVSAQGIELFGSTTGAMSTGQMSEILFMLVMPFCFARLGVKNMLLIGMLAWGVRYGLWGFAFGQKGPLLTAPVFAGILLHGICYDFFFVTGMIYTNKKAKPEVRGQAQSLVVMLTQGFGLGIGAQAFGVWKSWCTVDENLDWSKFWYAPAGFALGVMVLFFLFFWDRSVDDQEESSEKEGA
ncbi:MAG: MFS transporter [Planctomycetota bacterium]|nr:MFS transporter [Planctomycetota bacterium]